MLADNFALPLVGALWACTTLTVTVNCELNRIRNVILLGDDDGKLMPVFLREHMMYNDWLPMFRCIIAACLGFSAISVCSPIFLPPENRTLSAWSIAVGVAVYTSAMAVVWIPAARKDWNAMKLAIKSIPTDQSHLQNAPTNVG